MDHSPRQSLLLVTAMFCLLGSACLPNQTGPNPEQVENQVSTSVASTLTALPAMVLPTSTPFATATEALPPTPTFVLPATIPPTTTPNAKPAYACDIINQRPLDDTAFHRNESFDVKWTIVNIGTHRWEDDTFLEYQSGPEMTDITKVALPRLKPGEQHEVVLDAIVPEQLDRQIMVWAVYGPGTEKDSLYWMCYPYVRIIVER